MSIVGSEWLRTRVRNRELSAARKASSLFCVSESDRQRFASEGIAARFVPHGIELEPSRGEAVFESPELRQVESARDRGRTVCLFVGSSLARKSGGRGGHSHDGGGSWRREAILVRDCGILPAPGNPRASRRRFRSRYRDAARKALSCRPHCSGAVEIGHGNVAQSAGSVCLRKGPRHVPDRREGLRRQGRSGMYRLR